ncbi:type II toxin-antitoxin system HicB family antitoxin [Phyllobacterium leguminum]|uniref:Putative RNase H-like HicB family nuclease n=1 Tax=Phyllobacterium leguminum TaxID=314237 RepID=A0A318SX81_9HYPH|nr:type II toxin-antitoxin system HicB family antitoxin [Phyllobacterium leguminum]PYE86540.1 putative RNase H-like HicB family nuclease [Phyllobacterium leguminum]
MTTTRYIALIDGKAGAYGVVFPDAPGCAAMGKTLDEAIRNAVSALAEWIEHYDSEDVPDVPGPRAADELRKDPETAEQIANGSIMVVIPLVREKGRQVRANLSIDAGLLEAIDEAADASGLTRSAFLASAARDKILSRV